LGFLQSLPEQVAFFTSSPLYLEEDVAKPAQEHNGPHKLEPVVGECLAHPDTATQHNTG
jgi:hypothetical protein